MTAARPCSIADALGVVGEKYSLLILREVFLGVHRFDAMVRAIGAPRDILATRLRHLVEAGVLEKVCYNQRPPRYEYRPTSAGRELQGVLHLLRQWGDRHLTDRPPVVFEHSCGAALDPVVACRCCTQPVTPDSLTIRSRIPEWDAATTTR
ncbi:helix-turn-helix transcriptional regulator [Planomonospora sp. ID67723]|uniref:winged helix-turn-helix transcriptional regulator n=1 Tax=Planomonospora sp. ID67723 TaxID=2738134 RepID=UPI0018C42601|nr:helix-turn-helix domain-containing protein [Planomonospora sp. ID67723]MBG0831924.1 helix-turn-helix transcriptional regulator [Planomonospora sp. ID67723]